MDIDAVISRIRKLMAHAQGEGATEAEIKTYMAKARAIMDQFNIEEAELEQKDTAVLPTIEIGMAKSRAGKLDIWFVDLAGAAAAICDVRHYTATRYEDPVLGNRTTNRKGEPQKREYLLFYGLSRDIAVARALYSEFDATAHAMAAYRCGAWSKDGWTKSHHAYACGFASRLRDRAEEIKKVAIAVPTTTAIVLRKDALLEAFRDKMGMVPRKQRSKISDGDAYHAGATDAGNVSLGTNQIKTAERKQLS